MGPALDQTGPLEPRSSRQHEEGRTKRSCPQDLTSWTIRNPVVDYILGECVLTPGAI